MGNKKNCNISKKTAEQNINGMLEVVKVINSTDDKHMYPYKIKNIYVFGSFLSEKEKLGDIDIFIDFECRWDDLREMYEEFHFVRPHLYNQGIIGYIEWHGNAKYHILKMLRNNKKSFSFHEMDEFETLIKKYPDFKYKPLVENFQLSSNP